MTAGESRDTAERLRDIVEATQRIRRAEAQLTAAEATDDEPSAEIAYDAVLYNLVVVGEAVNALPVALRENEPEVPWRDIVDMRNFLAHEYFRVRGEIVRLTIDEPLDLLHKTCQRLHELS